MYFYTITEVTRIQTRFLPTKPLEISRKSDNRLLARLDTTGMLEVYTGYAWDGATPKWKALFIVIGAWDGNWMPANGRPQLWWATLVHDVIIQMMSLDGHQRYITWDYKDNDKAFLARMREVNFKYARLYYWAVRLYDKFSYRRKRK